MIKKAEILSVIFLVSVLLNSCFLVSPKTEKPATITQSDHANDTIEIVRIPYAHKPKVIEYEVSVLKGTKTMHGIKKRFYEHGSVYSETPYLNGKREGIAYTYYQEYKGGKPQVWKEQPYENNLLSGVCRRYHRNGKLQSEYEYGNGLPVPGIKVWKESGSEVKIPKLIVTKEVSGNIIRIKARMPNNTKKVKFYRGKMVGGKYISKEMKPISVNGGVGEMVLARKDAKPVTIVAVLKTPYRNSYYLAETVTF